MVFPMAQVAPQGNAGLPAPPAQSNAPDAQPELQPVALQRPQLIDTSRNPFLGITFLAKFRAWRQDPRVVLGALVVLAIVGGYAWLQLGAPNGAPAFTDSSTRSSTRSAGSASRNGDSNAGRSTDLSSSASGRDAPKVIAHIAGAVVTPGIVTLREGQRVVDAIAAAGGALSDADLDLLNLAARVADGERIFVPVRGAGVAAVSNGGTSGAGSSGASSGPIHLNSATSDELETLPGIGPSLASAIIELRVERGGFRSVRDLRDVPGIGEARFSQLESSVAL